MLLLKDNLKTDEELAEYARNPRCKERKEEVEQIKKRMAREGKAKKREASGWNGSGHHFYQMLLRHEVKFRQGSVLRTWQLGNHR